MEVLGAVAATGQLIGAAINILDSIARLRDFLQHAPARYQGWYTQLYNLGMAISNIRDSPRLQTRHVIYIIEGMAPKIESLADLCQRYYPHRRLKFLSKLNRVLFARGVEERIRQDFQSLEHDKTTLILTINTLTAQ